MKNIKRTIFIILILPAFSLPVFSKGTPEWEQPDVPRLDSFSPDVLNGYSGKNDIMEDLRRIGYEMLYNYTMNMRWYWEDGWYGYRGVEESDMLAQDVPESESQVPGSTADESTAGNFDREGYETNNQVEGISEGDIVKSDGKFIYIIYGEELISFSLDGRIISRVNLKSGYYYNNLYLYNDPQFHNNFK